MNLLSKLRILMRYGGLFFLLFFIISETRSQTISFSVDRQPLDKVFLLIEKQSGYNFIYSTEAIMRSKPVTLEVKNEKLSLVLQHCFKDQPLQYTIDEKHVVVKLKAEEKKLPAGRALRGKVVNIDNEPLSGVSISIQDTRIMTVSDEKGEFFFADAPVNAVLYFSSAEMEPRQISTGAETFIRISMSAKLSTLDETVIIAYGKSKKRYLTGSVVKVKSEEINRQPVSNPILALNGRVSGLQVVQSSGVPGASIQVRLRGRNSIANGNDPLYIVDGVPFPSASLNGSTGSGASIASSPLDNLNPASIESIEVLKDASATAIFGSRGANGVILITTKKGSAGQPRVNLQAYAGGGKITRQIDLLNTKEYLAMRREAFANDGLTPTLSNAPDLLRWDTTRYTDWQKQLIGNRMQVSNINASVSGGSAQTQFLAGTSYRTESSVFPGAFGADKISGMMNVSHQSEDKKFSLSLSASFLQNKSVLPKDDLTSLIRLSPDAPTVYQADGKLNWENSSWTNPYSRVKQVFTTRSETWQSNLQLGYQVLPGLQVSFSGGYTSMGQRDHYSIPAASINPATSTLPSAGFGHKDIRTLIAEPQVNYSLPLKGLHQVDILAGGSLQQSLERSLHQLASGYTSDELLQSITGAANISNLAESDIRYRYAALFGRINYNYAQKYLLSITMRRDGSSRYAPASRFATFGSAGAAWIFSKEKFISGGRFLSFGKLRMSAGVTGNDQIGDYKYLDLYGSYFYPYQSVPTFYPIQLLSPGYGWERVNKLEAGLDLSFWADRLSLTVNYYHNTTSNQLVSYTLPSTTGFSGILRNLPATIRNTGLEFELLGQIVNKSDFKWSASMNLTVPRNKLVSFENFESSTYANTYVLGQPLFIVKTYQYQGVDPSTGLHSFRDFDNNGQISNPTDRQRPVITAPKFFGGLQQTLSKGKFRLDIHFQFTSQPLARNYTSLFSKPGTVGNQPTLVLDRWQKPGQSTDIQRFTVSASQPGQAFNNWQASDAAYSDASFIRLRNLQLLYQFLERKPGKRAKMDCTFFIQGQNLLTITGYKGLDPETLSLLPPVRLFTGGVQLIF